MARRKQCDAPSPAGEGGAVPTVEANDTAPEQVTASPEASATDAGGSEAVGSEVDKSTSDAVPPAADAPGVEEDMAKVEIGAPSLVGRDTHVEARTVLAEAGFPQRMRVTNNTPSRLMLVAIDAFLQPGEAKDVEFRDQDHLTNFVTDTQHLCELNRWENGVVVETLATSE